jgi:aspartyl-tRNA(Asn)/glutamyl-tRNA(Gln) amidotransferase subunit B
MMNQWEVVIGLEVHAQLNTQSKIFSGAATAYGAMPNTQVCAVDAALPGVLPVLNKEAVTKAVTFGLAIDAEITERSVFARKNYFYPDLPKGYQISQFELPIVGKGHLDIIMEDGSTKRIGITRAHLEEDAGKSLHEDFRGKTGIDLTRAGTPLLEIVSEPDMRSAKEAVAYLKALHSLVRYLDICDGNMQEGSFRCDANVSVRPVGQKEFGTRTETKNLNSFRFVERAINYEIERQIEVIENGGKVQQETRLFNPDTNETRMMRSKEDANDYRYFPDPDLLPLLVTQELKDRVRASLPELPAQKRDRLIKQYALTPDTAQTLISSKILADYFETAAAVVPSHGQMAANWVVVELLGALNKANLEIDHCPVPAEQVGQLVLRIIDHTISSKIAKTVFEAMMNGQGTPDQIIESQGLRQVTDSGAIETMIDEIIAQFPEQLAEYRSGKDKLFAFFVGQAMKASKGKANPGQLNEMLRKKLDQK